MKGETVQLDIDKHVPKVQPQCRIPYHIRKKVEDALKTLEKEDNAERMPENEATPWVSPIVVVPKKDGGVRSYSPGQAGLLVLPSVEHSTLLDSTYLKLTIN